MFKVQTYTERTPSKKDLLVLA